MSEASAPGRRPAAPGDLRTVQDFVNTYDFDSGSDELATPARLRDWLADRALLGRGDSVSPADRDRALALREALRSLLLANNGERVQRGVVETLNRVAEAARFSIRFGPGAPARLQPEAAGVRGALGRIISIVLASISEGTWKRLKACRDDVCRAAFYDHSKNRSGTWCAMAVCGNRAKARSYRQRRRAVRVGSR
jgi:predicted RNA-binding Zn ribbon-like protein